MTIDQDTRDFAALLIGLATAGTRCVECGDTDRVQPAGRSGYLCKPCRLAFTIDHKETP